jgi:hypothetical protein
MDRFERPSGFSFYPVAWILNFNFIILNFAV